VKILEDLDWNFFDQEIFFSKKNLQNSSKIKEKKEKFFSGEDFFKNSLGILFQN